MMVTETDVELPDLDSYVDESFEPEKFPRDNELPDELQPKRARRSKKREREAVAAVTEAVQTANAMFALIVPCSCAGSMPAEASALGAHRDTCYKMYPLTEDEAKALAAAVEKEFETHPQWADKLAHADVWMAHIMLATSIISIVLARRARQGNIYFPPNAESEDVQRVLAHINGASGA